MTTERLSMRQTREILRQKWTLGLSHRAVARSLRVGLGTIIAAGTLVPEGAVVPRNSLFMGHPGKVRRQLTLEDLESIENYAARYVEYAKTYRDELAGADPASGERAKKS